MRIAILLIGAAFSLAACRPDAADDRAARAFLDRLAAGDSSGAAMLDPSSNIEWNHLRDMIRPYSWGDGKDLRLTKWEIGRDRHGPYRKYTYEARPPYQGSIVLWMVKTDAGSRINTMEISGFSEVKRP